jgi:anti-sigma regulatory factor (Ser/Thr protein kinase)
MARPSIRCRRPRPDLETDPDERDIGGLGIHLVRQYIEDLHYAREGEENVLRMTKLLPPI